jgi:hypothetical protein
MKEDYYLLKALNDDLSTQIITLQNEINALNATYSELQEKYDKLLADYNMVNGPSSKFTKLKDLNIIFTVKRTVYNYTDTVEGMTEIYYLTGEPFKGSFQISLIIGGTTYGPGYYEINGKTDWTFKYPVFKSGPGIYTLGMSWLKDDKGFYIQTGLVEGTGIQIEAK